MISGFLVHKTDELLERLKKLYGTFFDMVWGRHFLLVGRLIVFKNNKGESTLGNSVCEAIVLVPHGCAIKLAKKVDQMGSIL